jgi:hypothetical protein
MNWVTPQTVRMLDKYLLTSRDMSFVEKITGDYYAFKSPENKHYLISETSFKDKFVGPRISKTVEPESLIENDIFTIDNKEFSGVLQYKKKYHGDYYVMKTKDICVAISGMDMDCLSAEEKQILLGV